MELTGEYTREYHPVANIFPLLQDQEFEKLRKDIEGNGQLEPIWLHPDGRIIDGRNRHRACLDIGIMPQFRTWDGSGSLVSFVVSLNLHRRHLTSSQRAAVALDILPMLEDEARERMTSGVNQYSPVEIIPPPSEQGKARDQAASIVGTNGRYVSDAKVIKEKSPDLFEQVKAGEMTIPQAKREIVKQERAEVPPLPTAGKYRVIYADPPWKYGNDGIIGDTDHYGHVGRHYPSMTIDELCELPIRDLAENDAVLFLWVTSPLLEDAFSLIKAWGFKYKTSFVWDKVGHNFGHYNSVRHELLLVCTRGSCTPDNLHLYDSVQSIPKSDIHSEKPEQFREIIDSLYTLGNKIELFARVAIDGWEAWGNEQLSGISDRLPERIL